MKKITLGLLGIFLVIGIVAGVGFALYSSTVSISGVVFGTGNTDLKIDAYFNKTGWVSNLDPSAWTYDPYNLNVYSLFVTRPLYPGEGDWAHIKLINDSNPAMPLALTARLTSAEGAWEDLKGAFRMRICPVYGTEKADVPIESECGLWYTLEGWNSAARAFPGDPLEGEQQYWIEVELLPSVGPETKGKSLTNVNFLITGTQTE